jgi:hypothetical protein
MDSPAGKGSYPLVEGLPRGLPPLSTAPRGPWTAPRGKGGMPTGQPANDDHYSVTE